MNPVGRLVSGLGAAAMTFTLVAAVQAPATASGISSIDQLRNAPIPASCGHAATRLDGYSKDFGVDADGADRGFAALVRRKADFGRLKGVPGKVAAVPMVCSAGGVSWPQFVLLYGAHQQLLGHVDLGNMHAAQEHEDVLRIHFAHKRIHVRWRGYEGAGSTFTTFTGVIGWKHGHRTWSHTGPLTIDYARDRYSYDFGPGIVTAPSDAKTWLFPAPRRFWTFIRHRWHKDAGYGCDQTFVNVDRYSHKGFASGGEGGCGGAAYIWHRVKGRWRVLLGYQDGPFCWSMTKPLRRALHVLALSCYTRAGHTRHLGHWPRSGE